MPTPFLVSYVLAALAVIAVLYYHILSAVLAGLAVYVLTAKFARRLPTSWGTKGRGVALTAILLVVVLMVFGIFFGIWSFLQGGEGVSALLPAIADRLENLKQNLPPDLAERVPDTVEEVRKQLTTVLREHSKNITHVGMSGARIIVHVLFGIAIGAIAVMRRLKEIENPPPLAAALHLRLRTLADAFEKVVFAQVKISLLNTALTAIYLLAILPLFGSRLPMSTLLILLTFVAGLLPVVGNLISNTVILLISLGVSVSVGIASLVFLLFVHKLEYFTNAKIVGSRIKATSWEILSAMLVMEAIFGLAGMVAAPIVYAWLKSELKAVELV